MGISAFQVSGIGCSPLLTVLRRGSAYLLKPATRFRGRFLISHAALQAPRVDYSWRPFSVPGRVEERRRRSLLMVLAPKSPALQLHLSHWIDAPGGFYLHSLRAASQNTPNSFLPPWRFAFPYMTAGNVSQPPGSGLSHSIWYLRPARRSVPLGPPKKYCTLYSLTQVDAHTCVKIGIYMVSPVMLTIAFQEPISVVLKLRHLTGPASVRHRSSALRQSDY